MSGLQLPNMFFSTFHYASCKRFGDAWPRVRDELLTTPDDGPRVLGVQGYSFATLAEALHVATCRIHMAANTYIPRARCIAAAHFLRGAGKDCDVWLTVDDDTFIPEATIRQLVTACRATRGLVGMPYANRDGLTLCFAHVHEPTEWWTLFDGHTGVQTRNPEPHRESLPLRRVDRIGQGCVAMHRDMIAALDAACPPELHFRDQQTRDALSCPGIFLSQPLDDDWLGEDYWLCELARKAGHPVHVLLDAWVDHAGLVTKLTTQGELCIVGEEHRARMEEGIRRLNERAADNGEKSL